MWSETAVLRPDRPQTSKKRSWSWS